MNHAEALEKVRRHHLEPHQRKCQVSQTQSFIRQFFKLRVIGKERYRQVRYEFRDDESDTAYNGGTDYRQFETRFTLVYFPAPKLYPAIGCIPWLKPMFIIMKKNEIRFTIPYAPMARSPPYLSIC